MDCSPADLHRARAAAERGCRHLVPSRADAEDCASEAITWALSHPESLQGVANVEGWLVTVARRKAIDMARDVGRRQRFEGRLQAGDELPLPDHAEAVADRDEAAWLARRAQAALPARTHSVLSALSRGESVTEAADSLRLTPRAVESHLLRARRRMRAIITVAGGALAVLGSLVKRSGPAAVPLAVAAFSVVILVHQTPVAPGGGALGVPGANGGVTMVRADVHTPVRTAARSLRASRVRPQVHRRTAAAPPSAPVVGVGTPAGDATVDSQDRGGDDGPVAAVTGCLESFQVTPDKVGC